MSFYRIARWTVLVAIWRQNGGQIFRALFYMAFAGVTAWSYGDIATYLSIHHAEVAGLALIVKTLVVYAALFGLFWELRHLTGLRKPAEPKPSAQVMPAEPSLQYLDSLEDRPTLKSRRDSILDD